MAASSIINLGDIPLLIAHDPETIDIQHKWNYPVQRNITRKPGIQATGPDLDTMNIEVVLIKEWLDENGVKDSPRAIYTKLKKKADDYEILSVISGDGYPYGKFVIESMGNNISETSDNGGLRHIRLNISLKEFVS